MGNRGQNFTRIEDVVAALRRETQNVDGRLTRLIESLQFTHSHPEDVADHEHELSECYAFCDHTHGDSGGGALPEIVVAASDAPDDWIAVADYICDGISDHEDFSAAFSQAVDESSLQTGVIVKLSPGTFLASNDQISLPSNSGKLIHVKGCGQGVTRIGNMRFVLNTGNWMFSDMTVSQNFQWRGGSSVGQLFIRDVHCDPGGGIDYTSTNDSLQGWAANSVIDVQAKNTSGWSMYNCDVYELQINNAWDFDNQFVGCRFLNLTMGGIAGTSAGNSQTLFQSCEFTGFSNTQLIGLKVGDNVRNNVSFLGCGFDDSSRFNISRSWANVAILGCYFKAGTDFQVNVNTATYERLRQFSFIGNVVGLNYFDVTPGTPLNTDVIFRGIETPYIASNRFFARHVDLDDCTDPTFTNNLIEGWQFTASGDPGVVRIIDSTDAAILGNRFQHDGFDAGTSAAVYINSDTAGVFVDGNVYDTPMGFDVAATLDYGILIESGATGVRIGTNSWLAAGLGVLSDAGTSTKHWLLDRYMVLPTVSDDGLAIKYDVGSDSWYLDAVAESGGSPGSPTSPGGSGGGAQITGAYDIETPGIHTDAGMGDEFLLSTLAGKWTTISGTVGTVVYGATTGTVSMTSTPSEGIYDLSTRPGTLLTQTDYSDQFAMYQSTMLGSGEQIIVSMLIPEIPSFANNAYTAGISFTSSTSSPESGTYVRCYYDGSDVGTFKVFDGTSVLGQVTEGFAPGRWYFRAIRANSTIYFYVSRDGTIWAEVGTKADTSLTTFWVFIGHFAVPSSLGIAPIGGINWVRHVANTNLDPWPSDS